MADSVSHAVSCSVSGADLAQVPPQNSPFGPDRGASFKARPGPARRVWRLFRDEGPITAVRGGCSLLYARLTANSRVRRLRDWPNDAASTQATLAPRHLDDRAACNRRMAQLVKDVTAGCSNAVRADVFHMVAKRYCREADTVRLAALRQSLVCQDERATAGQAAGQTVEQSGEQNAAQSAAQGPERGVRQPATRSAPADARMDTARGMFVAMLDKELVRRRVVPPLQDLVHALETRAGAQALDRSCARLAVGLGLAGEAKEMRRALLKDAMGQLNGTEMRALNDFVRRELRAARKPDWKEPALPRYRAAEVRERRDLLMGDLQSAMKTVAKERLAYFIRWASDRIEDQYRPRQANPLVPRFAARYVPVASKDIHDDLRRVARELGMLLRSPENPDGVFDHASISSLCDREVHILRNIARPLEAQGLRIDSAALKAEAAARSRPHEERTVAYLQALLREVADNDPDLAGHRHTDTDTAKKDAAISRMMRTLFDCTRAFQTVIDVRSSFMEVDIDDIAQWSMDIARQARAAFGNADSFPAASPGIPAFWEALAVGLLCAARRLVTELDEQYDLQRTRAELYPAGRASLLMRRASMLVLAMELDAGHDENMRGPAMQDPTKGREVAGATDEAMATYWPAIRQAVIDVFGVDYDPQSGAASMVTMSEAQHAELARQLLAESMPDATREIRSVAVETGGFRAMEVDRQFVLDGYVRPNVSFSVRGVGIDRNYVPCVTSAPRPGDMSHAEGMDRALLALHRLAGPDTAALTSHMSQITSVQLVLALARMGKNSPLKLPNGDTVQLGDGGSTETHVTRLADGSYELDQTITWRPKMEGILAIDDEGRGYSVALDLARSHMALSYTSRLWIDENGGQVRQITGPFDLRFSMRELAAEEGSEGDAVDRDASDRDASSRDAYDRDASDQQAFDRTQARDNGPITPPLPDKGFFGSSDEISVARMRAESNGA